MIYRETGGNIQVSKLSKLEKCLVYSMVNDVGIGYEQQVTMQFREMMSHWEKRWWDGVGLFCMPFLAYIE